MRLAAFSALAASASSVAAAQPTNVTLNNGVVMPLLAIGTWQYNISTAEDELTKALDAGFRHIDTAYDYKNQVGVGKIFNAAIEKYGRENLFLTTKVPGCGVGQGARGGKYCGPDTQRIFDTDLQQLNVPFVDMILVHFPPGGCGALKCSEIQAQWAVMESVYAAKQARAIGVSNYCQSCFECLFNASKVTPVVNQLQYHVGMGSLAEVKSLQAYLDSKDIQLQAYSPLGDGSTELITGNLTNSIAKNYGKTGAQVALKWIVQQQKGLATKADDMIYIQEDYDMFGWELSDKDMQTLTAATAPAGTPSFMCTSMQAAEPTQGLL